MDFYDTGPENAPIAAKVAAYRRWSKEISGRVAHTLDGIFFSSFSGAALFKEIGRGKLHTLTIRPTTLKDDNSKRGKQTETDSDQTTVTNPDEEDDTSNKVGAATTVHVGELMLSPKGIYSQLTFAPLAGFPTDEILFHELVHASSMLTGTDLWRKTRMASTGKHDRFLVGNVVEFLAVQITNIYRQEKGRKRLRFNHSNDEFDGKDTLDAYPGMVPSPRHILRRFNDRQGGFFEALANVPASTAKINVLRQFRTEERKRQ